MRFVLDCSLTMSWCFDDEKTEKGDQILESLTEDTSIIVPTLWQLEVTNVLTLAERRGRITTGQTLVIMDFLSDLPIMIDENTYDFKEIYILAKTYNLTSYDAAYLDLALKNQVPLGTLYTKLIEACRQAGMKVL